MCRRRTPRGYGIAAAGFGQGGCEADVVGHGQGADLLADVGLELLAQVFGRLAAVERDEHRDRLALDFVRPADGRGFGDRRMAHQGAFDLDRARAGGRDTFSTSSMRPMIQ